MARVTFNLIDKGKISKITNDTKEQLENRIRSRSLNSRFFEFADGEFVNLDYVVTYKIDN